MYIIIATAAAIGGHGPLACGDDAARALEPAAGAAAAHLFAIGLLGASALAAAVVPLSTASALAEAVGVERSVSRRFSEAPLPRTLHGPGHRRSARRPRPRQPGPTPRQHAGPQRRHR